MKSHQMQQIQKGQQLEQIISLKVELAKLKSKLQSYKQFQTNYTMLLNKLDQIQRQNIYYKKAQQKYSEKLKRIMILLDIDYIGLIESDHTQIIEINKKKQNENINLKNIKNQSQFQSNMFLQGNKKQNQFQQSIDKNQFEIEFTLIEQRIKYLTKQNQEYISTLNKYQKSNQNIQSFNKQQKLITKSLQKSIKLKEQQLKQKDQQIAELVEKLEQLRQISNELEKQIIRKNQENKMKESQCDELNAKITQLEDQPKHSQKVSQINFKCDQLLKKIKGEQIDFELIHLKKYFIQQNLISSIMTGKKDLSINAQSKIYNKSKYDFIFE